MLESIPATCPEPARVVLEYFAPILDPVNGKSGDIGVDIGIPIIRSKLMSEVCDCYISVLQTKDSLIEIKPPIYIFGDIHGNIFDLLRLLTYSGTPPQTRLLFLGDYVDRGEYSLEVCMLLFALGTAFPDHVVLLRGNHEFEHVNQIYGFYDEVVAQKGASNLYTSVNRVFEWLPLGAVVGNSIFCVHGGLSPSLTSPKQLCGIPRPMKIYDGDLISDIVWSDPQQTGDSAFVRNQRGSGVAFGPRAISKFLKETHLSYIVRGHECVQLGIQKFGDTVYTVFSSSSYEEEKNRAGLMFVDTFGKIQVFSLPPVNIIPRKECTFATPMSGNDPWRASALTLNVKLTEIKKEVAKSFETMTSSSYVKTMRRRSLIKPAGSQKQVIGQLTGNQSRVGLPRLEPKPC